MFLVVNVTVKNVGKEMITTDSSFFQLLKGEVEYNPSTLITTKGDYFLYEGINPGLAQTGNVVFEIPEDMKDFVLNVQTGFWGTEQGQIELK
ncbi:Telomeric repeat-binding factor 2 [compost metagenome]